MNNYFSYRVILVAILLLIYSPLYAQTHGAIAQGENYIFWATGDTEWEAEQVAIEGCRKNAEECDIVYTSGYADATAQNGEVVYSIGPEPIFQHIELALSNCKHNSCKIRDVVTKPGFFSLANLEEDGVEKGYFVQFGQTTPDKAHKLAISKCNQNMKTESGCKIVVWGAIKGNIDAPYKDYTAPEPSLPVVKSPSSCRPTTNPIRCTSNCVDGNCKVTYENGCVLNLTVQAEFDAFNNQWTYPAPQC